MKYLFTLLTSLLLYHQAVKAQSRLQDSLSLINFYNKTTGSTWTNNSGWKTNPLNSWFGVKIKNNLIWTIILPSNNLTGNINASDLPNHPIGKLDLSKNKLSSFPAGIILDTLLLSYNKLTFTHLVPYAIMGNKLTYSGQDSVEQNLTMFGQQRDKITMNINTDISVIDLKYQWYKNGIEISGANSSSLILKCLTSNNAGTYTCKLTHNSLPNLSIFRKSIFLFISSDPVNAGPDDNVCLSTYSLRAVQPNTGTGAWSVISSRGNIDNLIDPNSAITGLTAGNNIFRWTIRNGTCPDEFDEVVVKKDTVGELPFAGKDMVICDSSYQLNATPLKYGKGNWELISGNLIFGQITNPKCNLYSIKVGEHILRWNANNGACANFFDEVKIIRLSPLKKVNAGKDTAMCANELNLKAESQANVIGFWKLIQGSGKIIDSSKAYSYVYNLKPGINKFEWTGWNVCANQVKDTVEIKIYDYIRVNPGTDTSLYYTPTSPMVISRKSPIIGGTGIFKYQWSPDTYLDKPQNLEGNFNPPDLGKFTFKLLVTDEKGCKDSAYRTINVIKVSKVDAPLLFTPNGDGINDLFILPGIESFPQNELIVMDKLGQIIFKQKAYKNQWDGTASEGSYSGTILPEDTYFYVLDLGEGKDKVQKGYIVIKK